MVGGLRNIRAVWAERCCCSFDSEEVPIEGYVICSELGQYACLPSVKL